MVEVPSLLFQLDELLDARRFPLGRLQRPDAVPLRRRPRQSRASPIASIRCRRRCCARCKSIADKAAQHGKPVTLCGELASKPIGALALVGARLPLAVADAVGGRPGQGDAARSRLPQRRAGDLCRCWSSRSAASRSAQKLESFAAAEGLQLVTRRCRSKSSTRCSPATPWWSASWRRQLAAETLTSSCRANSPSSTRWSTRSRPIARSPPSSPTSRR